MDGEDGRLHIKPGQISQLAIEFYLALVQPLVRFVSKLLSFRISRRFLPIPPRKACVPSEMVTLNVSNCPTPTHMSSFECSTAAAL